ncbi:MAG: serine hydroxymethyltransferase, partial [bacterium]
GKQFQDPLQEGADLLLGSTHKTFFGPMGGLILSNRGDLMEKIDQGISHRFLDNPHLNRIAALGVALEETRRHGNRYAKQVVSNAKALASALQQLRQPVKRTRKGFTMSHQVYLDFGGYKRGARVRDRLEKAGIIVDSGVRLGTSEVTRRGMREREMKTIAELMVEALTQRPYMVAQRVRRLLRAYRKTRFC